MTFGYFLDDYSKFFLIVYGSSVTLVYGFWETIDSEFSLTLTGLLYWIEWDITGLT